MLFMIETCAIYDKDICYWISRWSRFDQIPWHLTFVVSQVYLLKIHVHGKKKNTRHLQYLVSLSGHPYKYWSDSTMLNFTEYGKRSKNDCITWCLKAASHLNTKRIARCLTSVMRQVYLLRVNDHDMNTYNYWSTELTKPMYRAHLNIFNGNCDYVAFARKTLKSGKYTFPTELIRFFALSWMESEDLDLDLEVVFISGAI